MFQDPNTKRFKRTLIYFDKDTQYANFRGNPLCQATKYISVLVKINQRSFEPVCVWILFQNASRNSASDVFTGCSRLLFF